MRKIGFVIPWYGENIPGGAENAFRDITTHLFLDGVNLEIVTTCVKQFDSDWSENYYEPGLSKNSIGIPVRRFPADNRDVVVFDEINAKLCNGETVSRQEEETFMSEIINSQAMYDFLEKNQEEYEFFVGIPYMFGPIYQVAKRFPKKTLLIPCFHEEGYAHMSIFRECFSKVAGMFFNARPEKILANRLYNLENVEQCVTGLGMEASMSGDAETFRKKYNITDPFVLYAGRKDREKNIYTLIEYFCMYKKRKPDSMKLVLIGGGQVNYPKEYENDIIDLGFVPIQDKYDAYAAAEMLCQPSFHESFSYVIMESWLMKRPVLVHEKCDVTKNFVLESQGGLFFNDYFEFEGCVNYLRTNPKIADAMGENGRDYVLSHFEWSVVLKKYLDMFRKLIERNEKAQ